MADAREIVKRLIEGAYEGDYALIDEFVAPAYVGHDPAQPEPASGPAGFKQNVEKYRTAFEDARITVDAQVAEGDMVATRWTGRGTHTGEIAGMPATGKQVTVSGITIARFEGGQIVEDWSNWDTLGMLIQLGAVPAPTQA